MRKISAQFLLLITILLVHINQNTWAETVIEAKTIEIETILEKTKNQVEITEKELNYTRINQQRIKEKHDSDYGEIVQHTHETLETALIEIGEVNDSIDDFLGITYPHTRADGIGILDTAAMSTTASYIGDSEFYRESFYEIHGSESDELRNVNLDLWNTGIKAISSGLKALNSTLHIIQESVEDQVNNPELVLEDERTKYKDYRDNIIGYLEILRDNKSAIQDMDDEEGFSLLQEIELRKKEGELHAAKVELRKSERILTELRTLGDVELENL